jgi:hypothetical protein
MSNTIDVLIAREAMMSSADLQETFDKAQHSEESFRTIVDKIQALV